MATCAVKATYLVNTSFKLTSMDKEGHHVHKQIELFTIQAIQDYKNVERAFPIPPIGATNNNYLLITL